MILTKYKLDNYDILKIENDATTLSIAADIMNLIESIDLKDKNVIDGGCNIGIFSLVFSDKVGVNGKVYSFDVQSKMIEIAKKNASINRKKNIEFFNLALSDKSGNMVGFTEINYEGDYVSSGGIKTEPGLVNSSHCGSIETIAIDDVHLENVGLIKLDIEGYEPNALVGMWGTINKWKPHLIFELSDGYLGEQKVNEMVKEICGHGYKVHSLSDYNYYFEPIP